MYVFHTTFDIMMCDWGGGGSLYGEMFSLKLATFPPLCAQHYQWHLKAALPGAEPKKRDCACSEHLPPGSCSRADADA